MVPLRGTCPPCLVWQGHSRCCKRGNCEGNADSWQAPVPPTTETCHEDRYSAPSTSTCRWHRPIWIRWRMVMAYVWQNGHLHCFDAASTFRLACITTFMVFKERVDKLHVVNDCAERSVKDVTEFINYAKDAARLDRVMMVVNHHRQILDLDTSPRPRWITWRFPVVYMDCVMHVCVIFEEQV